MFRFAERALMNALIVAAAAAPLSGVAATVVVRDAPQTACKLASAPFAAHKTPYRSSHYVCGGVAYSVSDPRLTRTRSGAIVQADGARGDASAR